jgi:hypothetical protein
MIKSKHQRLVDWYHYWLQRSHVLVFFLAGLLSYMYLNFSFSMENVYYLLFTRHLERGTLTVKIKTSMCRPLMTPLFWYMLEYVQLALILNNNTIMKRKI